LSGGVITLSAGELCTYQSLVVDATSIGGLTIDAASQSRVMVIGGGVVSLTGLTLTGGSTTSNGGGIYKGGTLTLNTSTVSGNSATGTYAYGGGIYTDSGTLTLINSTVSGNWASGSYACGGGIYIDSGTLMLSNSTVSGNSAGKRGGGIYNLYGTLTLNNTTVSGNSATECTGPYSGGGGICNYYGTLTLNNSTVSGNSAAGSNGDGGGIYNYSSDGLTLSNSIVALNDAAIDRDISGNFTTYYSLVGGDPGFAQNPSAGSDGVWGTADDDYGDLHLRNGSICINAGDPEGDYSGQIDMDHQRRVAYGRVDIGADEFLLLGDGNLDGKVDYLDYLNWKRNVGVPSEGDWAKADFDADGDVDRDDFMVMVENFGKVVDPPAAPPSAIVPAEAEPAEEPAAADASAEEPASSGDQAASQPLAEGGASDPAPAAVGSASALAAEALRLLQAATPASTPEEGDGPFEVASVLATAPVQAGLAGLLQLDGRDRAEPRLPSEPILSASQPVGPDAPSSTAAPSLLKPGNLDVLSLARLVPRAL
ncbi:MAG: right-handed parallel beta-helix repeat-containing protein, partial [Phycisphaerae bacterium]